MRGKKEANLSTDRPVLAGPGADEAEWHAAGALRKRTGFVRRSQERFEQLPSVGVDM